MLQIENITKNFGGVEAIKGSDFSVVEGRTTALIGPNGAGKTTLFDIISGFVRPDTGRVIFAGEELNKLQPFQRANLGISRTFQQVRLFRYLTIMDHLIMSEDSFDTKFWRNIFKRPRVERSKYEAVLEQFGIERTLDTVVSDLSYGQRKLLQIAMALRRPHKLLMLDEPVAGVNSVVQAKIENLLLDLKSKGETILLIDHDMNFVRRLADHVIALDAGVVIVDGTPEQVLNDSRVLEAYLGV
ncbi:MAG: ABC transporter ATP-binding protein [Candidatus Magasanikbacteria bacterium]|nr:ABC transporter ATP-binding protein [Candidatus Magasanikbacteria bacterium]